MSEYVLVQDWLTATVVSTAERVQDSPVSIAGAAVCDVLVNVLVIGANMTLLLEGSDASCQNFRILHTLNSVGKHPVRLNSVEYGPLPTVIRWVARETTGTGTISFSVEAFLQ